MSPDKATLEQLRALVDAQENQIQEQLRLILQLQQELKEYKARGHFYKISG